MLKRTPEAELMDAPEQARAYAEADFSDANSLFVEHFLAAFADLAQTGHLLDLGCGPADISVRLADALPGWQVTGIDAGPNMLGLGRVRVAEAGLDERVELRLVRVPGSCGGPYDALVSNSLLHHLPQPRDLWQAVRASAKPGAAIQVMDLRRPATSADVEALVEAYADDAPEVLRQDFRNSLHAAYTTGEIAAQLDAADLAGLAVTTPSDRHLLVHGHLPA